MAELADLLIRGGTIYDGRGGPPLEGDVAIVGDSIAALGRLEDWHGRDELDARGKVVTPGFVNMLSWATESLLEDGRAQSDIRQGVTLEVMGEGELEHYRVPWDDGHESTYFPGPDARVHQAGAR